MSAARPFFDTNVLLYLFSGDPEKAGRAEALIDAGGVVSVQVLNEFANVALRKFDMPWPVLREALQAFCATLHIEPLTIATHQAALDIAERYKFGLYDSQILAAARLAGCDTVYSEDMQDAQRVEGVTIRSPFATASHP